MGFLRQAPNSSEGNDVSQEADHEQPGTAFYGQKNAQAQDGANHQVSHHSQKKIHG